MSKPLFDPEGSGKMPHPLKSLAETLLSPSLLEAIPDAIVAVNEEGIVVQVNSQTQDLFGYTRDELIGQKIEMLVPERQRLQHHRREGRRSEPQQRNLRRRLPLRFQEQPRRR